MAIDTELIDKLLVGYQRPEEIVGENGLLKELTKAILERAMSAELTEHLGYEKHDPVGYKSGNSRNGKSRKKIKGDFGEIEVETPRDRAGTFEPKIIGKHQTRFAGFDKKILSMYARGMSTRDIQNHLQEIYGVEVSPTLISSVTDGVMDEVKAWQSRPLEAVYPIMYMDALYVKIRDGGHVQNRAMYIALGVTLEGKKDVLGLWVSSSEGAKFWLQVLTELRNRGVEDVFISCVDGLKGFPEAVEAVFPKTQVQLCIVHLTRASLQYVSYKQKRAVAADLRQIYAAPTAEEAERQLELFAEKWDKTHPTISQIWRRNWQRVVPFFSFPPEIRRVIYTTNAVEALNRTLRKVTKTRGAFPTEEASIKLHYLAIQHASERWSFIQGWHEALNWFQVLWPDRMPALERG